VWRVAANNASANEYLKRGGPPAGVWARVLQLVRVRNRHVTICYKEASRGQFFLKRIGMEISKIRVDIVRKQEVRWVTDGIGQL
jgi:hypothetical protein